MKFTIAILGLFALSWLLTIRPATAAEEEGFVPLFDGKSLDGWRQEGGKAKYDVEEGQVVGTAVAGTPNSFLCTEKNYGDFILTLEFLVDPELNSGVQIRSQVFDKEKTAEIDGKEMKFPAGRVHGYQVEIDPSERAWTGGIYDEGRRGWLNNLADNEKARAAFKQGDWNTFRIECRGDSIKTWLNGVPAADLKDSLTPSGLIALQVHGVGGNPERAGKQVRWRNIRIKVLD